MSKQQIKKFRKNDWSYDEEEYNSASKQRVNKSKERRVERALRTKDISSLTVYEDEGLDPDDFDYMEELEAQELYQKRMP